MEFFQRESSYSSHKHAILTVFHAIELLLKEQLYQTNPVLIYKNIDKKVTDDSLTVGLADAIIRLENTGIKLPDDQRIMLEKIQGRRNRIEHLRSDYKEPEDAVIIAEALKVILYFTELALDVGLENHIDKKLLVPMRQRVMEYNELRGFAEFRFKEWVKQQWPKWDEVVEDTPEEFEGTHDVITHGHF